MAFPSTSQGPTAPIRLLGQVWPLDLFERRLLLQYDLVLPSSSKHVATLYVGPMGSRWAYIEGVDGLSHHFTATNSFD